MAQSGIQADWQAREFIEVVSGSIGRIAEFLNEFGTFLTLCCRLHSSVTLLCLVDNSTRYRLATLNEKLTSLERSLEFVEAKVSCVCPSKMIQCCMTGLPGMVCARSKKLRMDNMAMP